MRSRAAAIITTVALLTTWCPAFAEQSGQGSAADARVTEVNQHLAALVATPQRPSGASQRTTGLPSTTAVPNRSSTMILTPALIHAAARFTKAEHLLHYQAHGFDADFWGAFNGGRGMHVRYVIHF